MIKLSIEVGNAAFEDDNKCYEVARILEDAADKVKNGRADFKLFDLNGNAVGLLEESAEFFLFEPGEQYVVLEMETDNAAFEDENKGYEAARIMQEAAQKIRNGNFDFKLYDLNGNAVGQVEEVKERLLVKANIEAMSQITETTNMSLYETLKAAGIEIDHHASDLYVPVTPESKLILAKYPLQNKNASVFKSNTDGVMMFDIPFAYDPAWEKKTGISVADLRPDIKGRLLVEKAVSLDDAELHRVFDAVVAPEFCIRQAQKARNAGVSIGDIRRESLQENLQMLADTGVRVDTIEAMAAMNGTWPENGTLVGKVLKIDTLLDLVYLSKRKGVAQALPLKSFDKEPVISDEIVTVSFKDGLATVVENEVGKGKELGD